MFLDEKIGFVAQKTEQWRHLLLATVNYIEKYGWCQGHFRKDDGHSCILGACSKTHQSLNLDKFVWEQTMDKLYFKLHPGIISWNDAPGRSKDEVVAKLREIATDG